MSRRHGAYLAAGLALTAYLVINVHLPTDDDWWTISTMLIERGDLLRFAFRPFAHHWHPLFFLAPSLAVTFDADSYGLVFIRVLNCIGLFASLGALATLARALSLSSLATLVGMAVFALHQATVGVLRQWDAFGHLWGDAIARWVFVGVALVALDKAPSWLRGRAGAALLFAASFVAVTGTERVLGTICGSIAWFLPIAAHALGAAPLVGNSVADRRHAWTVLRKVTPLLASSVVAVVLLLTVRSLLGTPTGTTGRYGFGSLASVVQNVAQMGYALLTPVSTLKTFFWWSEGPRLYFWFAFALTLAVAGWLVVALWRRRARALLTVGALGATVAACFPVALMSHVSEHYLAGPCFFFSLVVMLALDAPASEPVLSKPRPNATPMLLVGISTYLLLHVSGFMGKEWAAAEEGARDLRDGRSLYAQLEALPSGTSIRLVQDPGVPRTYSSYTSRSGGAVLFVEAARRGKRWTLSESEAAVTVRLRADGQFTAELPAAARHSSAPPR